MTRRERRSFGVGAAMMAAGTLLPWVAVETPSGTVTVSGFGHGAEYVLALSVASIVLLRLRLELLAVPASIAAVTLLAVIMYALPGAMLDTLHGWQAGPAACGVSELGAAIGLLACGSVTLRAVQQGLLHLAVARATRRA